MTTPAIPLSVLIEAHKALGAITALTRRSDDDERAKAYAKSVSAWADLGAYLRTITASVPVEVEQ